MSETQAWHQLMDGAAVVTIRPRGHSMEPRIMDRQVVTIYRLRDYAPLEVNDVVLARVRGRICLHKVTAIDGKRVQISNNHGHVNGWTTRDKIAGIADV